MKIKNSVFIALLAIGFITACKTEKKESHSKKGEEIAEKKHNDCVSTHWSHAQGEEGPKNWVNLCDGYKDCGGKAQSPINITSSIDTLSPMNPIKPDFKKSKVNIINNGHTVQFNVTEGSTTLIENKEYKLLQFHYHALSEHTINGEHAPLEVHFVHKHSDSDFAVIGVMYYEGTSNPLFEKYLANFPVKEGAFNSEDEIALNELLPSLLNYYNYHGSLTTPPCSEVVNWYVLQDSLTASKEQIDTFSEILHDNYRPTMAINAREVHGFKK